MHRVGSGNGGGGSSSGSCRGPSRTFAQLASDLSGQKLDIERQQPLAQPSSARPDAEFELFAADIDRGCPGCHLSGGEVGCCRFAQTATGAAGGQTGRRVEGFGRGCSLRSESVHDAPDLKGCMDVLPVVRPTKTPRLSQARVQRDHRVAVGVERWHVEVQQQLRARHARVFVNVLLSGATLLAENRLVEERLSRDILCVMCKKKREKKKRKRKKRKEKKRKEKKEKKKKKGLEERGWRFRDSQPIRRVSALITLPGC